MGTYHAIGSLGDAVQSTIRSLPWRRERCRADQRECGSVTALPVRRGTGVTFFPSHGSAHVFSSRRALDAFREAGVKEMYVEPRYEVERLDIGGD